jgi:hypothetical protein
LRCLLVGLLGVWYVLTPFSFSNRVGEEWVANEKQTVMVLKYLIKDYPIQTLYFGIANVVANGLVMMSSVVLWVSQNIEDDYTYNLAL